MQNLLKTVAVIGFGSQGHAQALNLKDSGVDVVVGLRDDSPRKRLAEEAGLKVLSPQEAVASGDVVVVLLPDELQQRFYQEVIVQHAKQGAALVFAHGFSIHYGLIVPRADLDVWMVAPKGPGRLMRKLYLEGQGIPGLIAIHQDISGKSQAMALQYATALGLTRRKVIATSFKDETETDLFGEQVVLCGGLIELAKNGFQTLVDAGYPKELAFSECVYELKLIVDLLMEKGLAGMQEAISNTAEYGGYTRGPRIVGEDSKKTMQTILKEIQSGDFAREWMAEVEKGMPRMQAERALLKDHAIDAIQL